MRAVRHVFTDGKLSFLTETAWTILQHQLHKYLTGKMLDAGVEETLQAYRQLVLEAYGLSSK